MQRKRKRVRCTIRGSALPQATWAEEEEAPPRCAIPCEPAPISELVLLDQRRLHLLTHLTSTPDLKQNVNFESIRGGVCACPSWQVTISKLENNNESQHILKWFHQSTYGQAYDHLERRFRHRDVCNRNKQCETHLRLVRNKKYEIPLKQTSGVLWKDKCRSA